MPYTKETLDQIQRLEAAIESPTTSEELKEKMRRQLKELQVTPGEKAAKAALERYRQKKNGQ